MMNEELFQLLTMQLKNVKMIKNVVLWTDVTDNTMIATVFYKQTNEFILYKVKYENKMTDIRQLEYTTDYHTARTMFQNEYMKS